MIPSFEEAYRLWLALPWLAALAWALRRQGRAFAWLEERVEARFRGAWTAHDSRSWKWHGGRLAVAGLLLIVAAARPTIPGEGEVLVTAPEILLVVDASASMNAEDVDGSGWTDPPKHRFEAARRTALELVEALPEARFGVLTYSGVATVQLPVVDDPELVKEAVRAMELHNFYQSTGSDLAGALEAVLPYAVERERPLQVVLVGDGEIPALDGQVPREDYLEPLGILVELEVPVHALTVGSTDGQGRVIFDFRDVVAGKEERSVLREFVTRRVDDHFRRIAEQTGGSFRVLDADTAAALAEDVRGRGREPRDSREDGRRDVGFILVLAFLLLWMHERLVPGPRRQDPPSFDLSALGDEPSEGRPGGPARVSAVAAALVLGAVVPAALGGCGRDPELRAHRLNEKGIGLDRALLHGTAQSHYRRSRAFDVRPEVPLHNQARSLLLAKKYAEAHDLFQEALELDPELAEALFNDGVTLHAWGEAERDPENCALERTLDLWKHARDRFVAVSDASPSPELEAAADANHDFLGRQIQELERLIAEPPEACRSSQASASSSDEEDSGGGGASDGGDPDPNSTAGEPPPQGAPDDPQDPEDPQDPRDPSGDPGDPGDQNPMEPDGHGDQDPPADPPPGDTGRVGGQADRDPGSGPEGRGGGGGLSPEENEQVQAALARIAGQGETEGRYHRKTRAEQFSQESWENPERVIWW